MRDIKFRVWDNVAKKYIDSRYVSISGLGLLHVAKRIIKNCFRPPHTRKNPWFIVEQYTGLRDKNGTEIYDGDICSFASKTGKHVGTVEWTGGLASFGLRMVKNNFLYTFSELDSMGIDLDTLEIIGNIHENSELVEEK